MRSHSEILGGCEVWGGQKLNLIFKNKIGKIITNRQIFQLTVKSKQNQINDGLRILHPRDISHQVVCVCLYVCLCVCISFLISKDVSNSSVVVYVIICRCNSQSSYSQSNFLRFVNIVFHSYILCLFHHSLIKCSCNYQVYFYGSHF